MRLKYVLSTNQKERRKRNNNGMSFLRAHISVYEYCVCAFFVSSPNLSVCQRRLHTCTNIKKPRCHGDYDCTLVLRNIHISIHFHFSLSCAWLRRVCCAQKFIEWRMCSFASFVHQRIKERNHTHTHIRFGLHFRLRHRTRRGWKSCWQVICSAGVVPSLDVTLFAHLHSTHFSPTTSKR